MLIDPLVIFSAYEGWDWAQKTLLDKFIVPSLKMYARKKNERAFTILSALYGKFFSFNHLVVEFAVYVAIIQICLIND